MPRAGAPTDATPPSLAAGERELAMHGLGLSAAAAGIAHEVRNPLNAIVLQLALVTDRIGAHPELAQACASHLAKVRDQIGRVDEVVRRFVDAADPAPGPWVEVQRLLRDAAVLFTHEARHRHLALAIGDAPCSLRARGDAPRVERLWVGLVLRAIVETSPGGSVRLSAAVEGREVVLCVEHGPVQPSASLAWIGAAVGDGARALGGRLEESRAGERARSELRLPTESR